MQHKLYTILLVFSLCLLLAVRSLEAETWSDFAHPSQPHSGVNGPITTIELFVDQNVVVTRPVLVVLMEFTDLQHESAHDVAYFTDMFFGEVRPIGRPSIAETFRENSNGRLLLVPAADGDQHGQKDGIVGWVTTSYAFEVLTVERKRAEAVRVADPFFDYSIYDQPPHGNGDGIITKDELIIVLVNADPAGGANVRSTDPNPVPVENGTLVVSQAMSGVSEQRPYGDHVHELGHQALGHWDLYEAVPNVHDVNGYLCDDGTTWYPPPPGPFSLMDRYPSDRGFLHVDPWAKIHLGFVKPQVITHDGTYTLYDAETERSFAEQDNQTEALIIYDPLSQTPYKEYFVLENRNRATQDDQGLVVWLINEHETNLRKVVRLIRREGHWPTLWHNEQDSLWDGIDDVHGYDLTETSTPRNTNWTDGTSSYIEIYDISPAGPSMTFKVRMPPVFVDYVNSGTETGSQESPFKAVGSAVNAISEHPRSIKIAGGAYDESLILEDPVTLMGWKNGNAIIGEDGL